MVCAFTEYDANLYSDFSVYCLYYKYQYSYCPYYYRYFGPENSRGWAEAVEAGRRSLMCIWMDKKEKTCRGRVASLVETHMQVHVC